MDRRFSLRRFIIIVVALLLAGCQTTGFDAPIKLSRAPQEASSHVDNPRELAPSMSVEAEASAVDPQPDKEDSDPGSSQVTDVDQSSEPPKRAPLEAGLQSAAAYAAISNEDFGWWFQKGPPSTIDASVAQMIEPHHVYWQAKTERPVVYLTFDQGYEHNDNTSRALDTLKEKNAKAMFFVVGSYVDRHPDLIERIIAEGHQVGNHSVNHLRPAKALDASLDRFVQDVVTLQKKVPQMTMHFRPPEGGYSPRALQVLDDLGYYTVFWSFAYKDWLTDEQPDPVWAKQYILDNLFAGSILLLHTVSDTNVAILGDLIDGIRAAGYTIEPLPDPYL